MIKHIILLLGITFLLFSCEEYKWNNILDRDNDLPDVAQPILNPPGNTYTLAQTVSITCSTTGANIFYTLDGTEPAQTSNPYLTPVFVPENLSLKARAFKENFNPSPITSGSYVITTPTCSNPFISPAGDYYSTPQNITITCTTSGAEIRYTIDGSDPTPASALYNNPFIVSSNTTVKARAFKTDFTPSQIVAQVYEFIVATPIINPTEGYFTAPQHITITCPTSGAEIKYTTDGTEPTNASTPYTQPIYVYSNTQIKAKAFKTGCTPSSTVSANYTFNLTVAIPVITPGSGTYNSVQQVSISCETEGATIHYTLDNTEPTQNSTLYTGALIIDFNKTLKAKAFKTNWISSGTTIAIYIFQVGNPVFNPPAGNYTSIQSVNITSETFGAEIYYTTDGSNPTTSSNLYTGSIDISSTQTLKALAVKEGWTNSSVIAGDYIVELTVPTPVLDPPGGNYTTAQEITISCSLQDAVIRYTLNGSEPNSGSPIYSTPILIDENKILKAKAFKTNWTASQTVTGNYTIGLFYDFEGWNGNFFSQAGWLYGTPDQITPYSGTTLWAMALTGNYTINAPFVLLSPAWQLSENSVFSLWHSYYFNFHQDSWNNQWRDVGRVYISVDNGLNWTQLTAQQGYADFQGVQNSWSFISYDLSSYQNQDVILKFDVWSNGDSDYWNVHYSGWFIDDVQITNATEVRK